MEDGAPKDPRELPLYRLAEAAHYLRVPVSTLRGWISGFDYHVRSGTRRAAPLIRPPEGASPDRLLSFLNLVEAHILASLRRLHHVPMHRVRTVLRLAGGRRGTRHPLLHARLSPDGQDLVIDREGGLMDPRGQRVFPFAAPRPFGRIEWDAGSALPVRLYPLISGDGPRAPQRIVIDPERAAGRPIIAGTQIPTAVVAARHRAGESVSALAGEYGLDPSSIEDALRCAFPRAA